MKLLVVAGEKVNADQIRSAVGGDADPAEAEVMVVAPALQGSGIRFWFSDVDEAIARADTVQRETVDALQAEGGHAHGDTGEADPEMAIADALQTFAADRIVVFTSSGAQRYREDVDGDELASRFGVPVSIVTA